MRRSLILFWLAVVALAACLPWTGARAAGGQRWALLVGVEEYDNPDISPLAFAVRDVTTVAEALRAHAGFAADHITVLTSAAKDAGDPARTTNTNVLKALDRLAPKVGPDDTFLFYFSGHGFSRDGQTFLGTVNADPADAETLSLTALPVASLQRKMRAFQARQVIFVIDACRNDPQKGKGDADNLRTVSLTKDLVLASRPAGSRIEGSAVLFACKEGQRAYEDRMLRQGVFTHFLVQALAGGAPPQGGDVLMTEVADYVQKQVLAWAGQRGKQQDPELVQVGAAKIVLASGRPAAGPSTPAPVPTGPASTGMLYTTELPPLSAKVGDVWRNPKDGSEMAWIPPGAFLMGCNAEELDAQWKRYEFAPIARQKVANESPAHEVRLSGFWMSRNLVTVAQYRRYCEATGKPMPASPPWGWRDDHPIVNLGWFEAAAYCEWVGGRLPSEAEWEYAARGGNTGLNGKPRTTFVWGDDLPEGSGGFGNLADESRKADPALRLARQVFAGYDDGYGPSTSPVGAFRPNGYGLYDMAGNVQQWCLDRAHYTNPYPSTPVTNPVDGNGGGRQVRGSSWWRGGPIQARVSFRFGQAPGERKDWLGFRVVRGR